MRCPNCGTDVASKALACETCGRVAVRASIDVASAPPAPAAEPESLHQALVETKRAARALARGTTKIGRTLYGDAKAAAKDAGHVARRVAHRVGQELDGAVKDFERTVDQRK